VEVVVEVAEVMSIQGHQPPGKVHGRIGFGSRNRVAVGQEQGGGQVRGDGFSEPGCAAWRLRVSDAATVSCLTGSDCFAKTGLDICLHSSNGWRLVILAVSCPGWQPMTRKESIPGHATHAGLPRSPRRRDHAELMGSESLPTPSAALSLHTTGWPSRSGASPDLAPQPCSRGFATLGLRSRYGRSRVWIERLDQLPESLWNHPAGSGGPSSRRPAASSSLLGQRCALKTGAP
jgi:hypothetical protein